MEKRIAVALQAVRFLRQSIRWKTGKVVTHLEKRIRQGHLAEGTTVAQYEAIIAGVIRDSHAELYIYEFGDQAYPTVVALIQGRS